MKNQAYTEAFRDGMRAAANGVSREQANALAHALPVREGDAFLAGYYAEKRKLRA
jgi:DNA polymerase IIIc chi subunit